MIALPCLLCVHMRLLHPPQVSSSLTLIPCSDMPISWLPAYVSEADYKVLIVSGVLEVDLVKRRDQYLIEVRFAVCLFDGGLCCLAGLSTWLSLFAAFVRVAYSCFIHPVLYATTLVTDANLSCEAATAEQQNGAAGCEAQQVGGFIAGLKGLLGCYGCASCCEGGVTGDLYVVFACACTTFC